ncbi:efflux RND transporter periplasmic adaptor subunit [Pseudoalteromonas denitrificans]|uniref:RND family efflux transporter, MFP subunit n=1 Tax=Pseudoalteromonas denitrificans DSM 6059 TaxID=1123010 RepID=A0A1I1FG01_9GAMM|nr:efflux RND transporter periplasmic adaptor subunit [Pseudoalteromonas denitrificans]SFB98295.1 RND family efflux transporter, MFP subunit [Pseudoalteromonas denitrificans DSM 6059]
MKQKILSILITSIFSFTTMNSFASSGEDHKEEASGTRFSSEQMQISNIEVTAISPTKVNFTLYAPGELKANGYTSYSVSPRVDSIVVKRHAILGQHIQKGSPLVTLFSVDVANAQAQYRLSLAEWSRVKKLGKATVTEKRFLEAKAEHEVAYSTLKAYGLSEDAIKKSAESKTENLGQYTLFAQTKGAVLADAFLQGKRVIAGDEIMLLADEHQLWVEAQLPPNSLINIPEGTKANILIDNNEFNATVIQEGHTIDQQSRTRTIRLAVDNEQHQLHPGMFTDVNFLFNEKQPVMTVPETALMRGSDGDWMVYVEDHPGEFEPVEVELGRTFVQGREISGIKPGTRVVIKGAFFVASQIAKGGFDPHNH